MKLTHEDRTTEPDRMSMDGAGTPAAKMGPSVSCEHGRFISSSAPPYLADGKTGCAGCLGHTIAST
jgi:hypothetical protein